jgi:cell wall-associated NlpC family hydrolase
VIGAGYSKNPRMGPTYDCSGLTTMAWRAAGVSIPTVSNTQYAGLPHVPLNAVQPGDLIFWGPGGSAHVALYIGGGQIIDASSSQGQVTQRSMGRPDRGCTSDLSICARLGSEDWPGHSPASVVGGIGGRARDTVE